jgi:hypothetical protein
VDLQKKKEEKKGEQKVRGPGSACASLLLVMDV